jgi:hypothetical protein
MANTQYAFIKDNVVVNVVMFDDPTEELLNQFKEEHQIDEIVLGHVEGHLTVAQIGDQWNGRHFIEPQPWPSWILNTETDYWNAPVAPPEGATWADVYWDEENLRWVDRTAPITPPEGKTWEDVRWDEETSQWVDRLPE